MRLAVASNFANTAKALASLFTRQHGTPVRISQGSSGALATQISRGAPYDIFLSADQDRPLYLVDRALAVADSRFTYARGRLVLISTQRLTAPWQKALGRSAARLAIANPTLAPYGAAARQVLEKHGLWQALAPKLLRGENVAQATSFVLLGGADAGIVGLAQVEALAASDRTALMVTPIDSADHQPIAQDAVILSAAAERTAARRFMTFLRSAKVQALIIAAGYEAGDA